MLSLFPVLLSVTVILSVISAILWMVMYELLGVATISVLLSGLLAGYLFSSIVFYTPFGKLKCILFKAHVQRKPKSVPWMINQWFYRKSCLPNFLYFVWVSISLDKLANFIHVDPQMEWFLTGFSEGEIWYWNSENGGWAGGFQKGPLLYG